MKRWTVLVVFLLLAASSAWAQESYCVTIAGDTLWGKIKRDEDVITIKQGKKSRTLLPDEFLGYTDRRTKEFIYSKPVRYLDGVTVYALLRKEVTGNINLYSRIIKYTNKYSIRMESEYGIDNSIVGSRKVRETEYYLERDTVKIQLATRDVIYDFVRGDYQSTERVNDPKFKIEKHLKELIEEYNEKHREK